MAQMYPFIIANSISEEYGLKSEVVGQVKPIDTAPDLP